MSGAALPVLEPMLAVAASIEDVPEGFLSEFKWDGVRALAAVGRGGLRLTARRGSDITARYPELSPLADAVDRPVLLDGEIVALDERARPDFERLQSRINLSDRARIATAAEQAPVVYLVFDLLHEGDRSLLDAGYEERRTRLAALELSGARWQTPPHHAGAPGVLLGVARDLGLEGLVAKRPGSPYRPGRRSRDWRKVRLVTSAEFVVGGYAPVRTTGAGVGALLLGTRDRPGGPLRYAGSVGSGLTEAEAGRLERRLRPLRRDTPPFADPVERDDAVFVEPEVVVEVAFSRRTREGRLRQPVYLRRRPDRDSASVVRDDREQ